MGTRKPEELNSGPASTDPNTVRGLEEMQAIADAAEKGKAAPRHVTAAPEAAAVLEAAPEATQDAPPDSLAETPTPDKQEPTAASEDPLEAVRGMLSWFDTMNPPATGEVIDFMENRYPMRFCIPAMSQAVVSGALDRMFDHFKTEALLPMINAFGSQARDGNMAGMATGFVKLLTNTETIIAVGQCFDDSHPGTVEKMRKNYNRRRAALVAVAESGDESDIEGPSLEWMPELNPDLPISTQVCELQEVVAGIIPFAWRLMSSSGQTASRMLR